MEDIGSGVSVAVLNPKLVGKVIDEATQNLVRDAALKLATGEVKVPRE